MSESGSGEEQVEEEHENENGDVHHDSVGEDKGEGEGERGEETEAVPDIPLTEEVIGESLSLLCKTGDGLSHAYVRLDITNREITDITKLKSFIHLRYMDISNNQLKDISVLSSLTHILTLRADHNLLTSAKMDEMPYLQMASFNHNKIMNTEGINHPLLEHISLNFNEIKEVTGLDPTRLTRLHSLELRSNKLENTLGLTVPNIKNLFLGANMITKLEGLDRLDKLTTLHLRDNQLKTLDGLADNLKKLQYINVRGNGLTSLKELTKLKCLPLLRALVCSENPMSEEDEYRLEVLIALRRLERLDKDEFTEDERTEAEDIYEQRRLEADIEKEDMIGSDADGD